MKRAISLEEERQALLEQIHTSRAAYRRMLAQYDGPAESERPASGYVHEAAPLPKGRLVRGMPAAFPRSATMRWVMDHPTAVAGVAAGLVAVVALAAIGPRRIAYSVRTAPAVRALQSRLQGRLHREPERPAFSAGRSWPERDSVSRERELLYRDHDLARPARPSLAGTALASAAGIVSMLMRDPARMRMAARAATTAIEWLKNRRQQQQMQASRRPGSAWQQQGRH
ncbi:MAG: hypothetical protein JWP36_2495 [Paucimonas sp.]|nr:hypothetical protein [Paucimonas sp.]